MITRQYIVQSRHLVAADHFAQPMRNFSQRFPVRKCAEDLTYDWPDSEELGLRMSTRSVCREFSKGYLTFGLTDFFAIAQRFSWPCRIRSFASGLTTRFFRTDDWSALAVFFVAGRPRFGPSLASNARTCLSREISTSISAMIDSSTSSP
jgi:hypothetical protein